MPRFISHSNTELRQRQELWHTQSSQKLLSTAVNALKELVVSREPVKSYMLWIDGVGAWQLYVGTSFTIGAPTFESQSADITLLANISRRHAALHYDADQWQVTADHPASVSGKSIRTTAGIRTGDQLCLAERVRLGFRVPSVLSSSAVIDFESNHRPTHTVDGIILMVDHCLLGPRRDHHICCPDWPDVVVLYAQGGSLRCRSSFPLTVNGKTVKESAALSHGAVVDGEDLRFRIEEIH